MDDELAAMNQSLDEAENNFSEEHHNKIEIDQDPNQTSQEIKDQNGVLQEDDQVSLNPDEKQVVDEAEPLETESNKNPDNHAKSNVIEDPNPSHHDEDHHTSEHVEDQHTSEHAEGEHTSEHAEETDQEHTSQENKDVDPSTELQEKAGDNLKEGEDSIFKSKGKLEKDDAVVDETDENAEQTTDEKTDDKKEEHPEEHSEGHEESRKSGKILKIIFSLVTLMLLA